MGTPRCEQSFRRWFARRRAGFTTAAWLASPAAEAATRSGEAWTLIGAICVGALIAIGAVLVAHYARGSRDVGVLRRTLAASSDWWWRTDATMKVVEIAPGQRARSDIDPRRLLGRAPWQVVEQVDLPAPLRNAIDARAPFFDEPLTLNVNGNARVFAFSGTPLFSAGANFDGYVGAAREITGSIATTVGSREQSEQIERLQAEAAERSRQFELAVKDLDSFAHSVSHDLRAPLRVIDGFATIVLEDYGKRLDELGRGHLQRIIAAGSRMNSMIDTLLELSRTTGRDLERERVDLSQLARDLIDELSAQSDLHEGPRNMDVVIADGLVADGDRTLLRLVLQNLLSNACKFTARVPVARIEFGADESQGRRVYFVRDNGAGFDMRFADKLFGLFQRFHSQSEFPGTGVGLATVQRIVRKHGGRIWAESEPGKGATFHFTLWEH